MRCVDSNSSVEQQETTELQSHARRPRAKLFFVGILFGVAFTCGLFSNTWSPKHLAGPSSISAGSVVWWGDDWDKHHLSLRCRNRKEEPKDDATPSTIATESGSFCRKKWCHHQHDKPKDTFVDACTCRGDFYMYPEFQPWCINVEGRKDYCVTKGTKCIPDEGNKCSKKMDEEFQQKLRETRMAHRMEGFQAARTKVPYLEASRMGASLKCALGRLCQGKTQFVAMSWNNSMNPDRMSNNGILQLHVELAVFDVDATLNKTTGSLLTDDLIPTEFLLIFRAMLKGSMKTVVFLVGLPTMSIFNKMKYSTLRSEVEKALEEVFLCEDVVFTDATEVVDKVWKKGTKLDLAYLESVVRKEGVRFSGR